MDRENQFITMVQTAIITKYVCDPGDGTAPLTRPMWAIQHLEEAFKVAHTLPPDVAPKEAAEAFVRWIFQAEKESGDDDILSVLLPSDE